MVIEEKEISKNQTGLQNSETKRKPQEGPKT